MVFKSFATYVGSVNNVLWTWNIKYTHIQRKNFYQRYCGAVFDSATQLCQIKPEITFCGLPVDRIFLQGLQAFILFRLLEYEILKMFSMQKKRRKRKQKFDVFKAEEVTKSFVNLKFANNFFGYCVNHLICSLNFKNILWTLSLLHIRTMNGVISWYILALQRLFHFIVCVSFFSISFFFFVDSITCWSIEVSLSILRIKQWSCS